jgi:ribosomal protein S14
MRQVKLRDARRGGEATAQVEATEHPRDLRVSARSDRDCRHTPDPRAIEKKEWIGRICPRARPAR